MSHAVELWFHSAPSPAAIALAVEPFGRLRELRDGSLHLVEGDEPPQKGIPLLLDELAEPPEAVKRCDPWVRAALRIAPPVLASGRGLWLAQLGAALKRRLGGVLYLPATEEAYSDVAAFEASWPDTHVHAAGTPGTH